MTVASRLAPVLFGGFLPTDIAGLVLWLRADSLNLADGASVDEWNDESGQENDVTQGTAADQPVFKTGIVNDKPVVRIDETNDFLTNTSLSTTIAQPFWIFVVFTVTTASDVNRVCDTPSGDRVTQRYAGTVSDVNSIFAGTFLNEPGGTSLADSQFIVTSSKFDGTDSLIRQNGTETVSGDAGTNAISAINIGANPTGGQNLGGDIAEFLIYDADLSSGDIQQIEDYLNGKYALF